MRIAVAVLAAFFWMMAAAPKAEAVEVRIGLWEVVDSLLALPFKLINAILGPAAEKPAKPDSLPVEKSPHLREV